MSSLASPVGLTDLFKCLGDPSRLRILRALGQAELGVGELADVLGLAQSSVSRHLQQLRTAGLVQDRREGASSLYRLPERPRGEHASVLWPTVREWLDQLPEAPGDARRLSAVLAVRRKRSSDLFEQLAPHWDGIRQAQHGDDLRTRALLELVPSELTVLDVGTGTGFMLLGVAPRVRAFIGVDASEAMLARARENLAAAGHPGADLRLGSMEDLPVEEASVDVVLGNMVLHHAEAPGRALAEFVRVLRPGGRVVLTDLARHELDWTREELGDAWPGFEPDELMGRLTEAGLLGVRVEPVGTCTLARSGRREGHVVDVLLATGQKRPV